MRPTHTLINALMYALVQLMYALVALMRTLVHVSKYIISALIKQKKHTTISVADAADARRRC